MRKIFKKPLVYLLAFMMLTPTWLVTGIFNAPHAQAASAEVTKLAFSTDSQTIDKDAVSGIFTVKTQNSSNESKTVSETTYLDLTTTSLTGEFSSSKTTWTATARLTMGSDTSSRSFYYKDTTAGTFNISVTAESHSWTPAVQSIEIVVPDVTPPVLENVAFQSQLNQTLPVNLVTDTSGNYLLMVDNVKTDSYSLDFNSSAVSSEKIQPVTDRTNIYGELDLKGPETFLNFAYIYSSDGNNFQLIDPDKYNNTLNSEIVAPTVPGDLHTGDYQLSGDITDLAGNSTALDYTFVVSHVETVLPTDNKIPSSDNSDFDLTYPNAGGVIDLSELVSGINKVKTNGAITVHSMVANGEVDLVIPSETTIECSPILCSPNWNYILNLPTAQTLTASLPTAGAGSYFSADNSIEIGLTNGSLVFDKPVQIMFIGKAGESAGFVGDSVFFPIIQVCDDVTTPTTFSASGECKIDSGNDLVIWTKHFTNFATYKQITISAPIFTAMNSIKNGVKTITISWTGVGANLGDSYLVTVNGVAQTIPALANDLGQSYTKDIPVGDYGNYSVLVQVEMNGIKSLNTTAQTVSFVAPAPAQSIAPEQAQAAAPSSVSSPPSTTTTPSTSSTDDNGKIKGDESQNNNTENNSINWTPWIVLFVLILLAGAATGGYFYWFGGEEEVKAVVKEPKKTANIETPTRKVEGQPKNQNKKSKRW